MIKKRYTNRNLSKNEKFTLQDAEKLIIRIKKTEGVSQRTIRAYQQLFDDYYKFFDKDVDVKELTVDDANDYVYWQLYEKEPYSNSSRRDKIKEKGVSVITANNYIVLSKSVFKILNEKELADNIFTDIKKLKEEEQAIETLSIDEINKLFNEYNKKLYAEFRNYVICHVMLDCFSRISETVALKQSDVNFDSKTIIFNKTKSKKMRVVPVSDKTLKLIKELIKENEVFDTDYLFLTITGNNVNSDTFRKNLNLVAKRAGISSNVYPHVFRHTASKMFIQEGGNIRVLQKILGHASVETTERYAHVLAETVTHYHESFSPISKLTNKSKTRTNRKRK